MAGIDDIDILILKEFCKLNGKETTTWQVMKKIYPEGKDVEHDKIKHRIKKMESFGLFFSNGESKRHYKMIEDNVKLQKIKFPDKLKNAISIKVCGKWSIFEV